MSDDNHTSRNRTMGGALDIKDEDVMQPLSDADLKGKPGAELDPDGVPKLDVATEAAQQKNDAYMLKTDMEDRDIRGSTPGMPEQD